VKPKFGIAILNIVTLSLIINKYFNFKRLMRDLYDNGVTAFKDGKLSRDNITARLVHRQHKSSNTGHTTIVQLANWGTRFIVLGFKDVQ
jgi:hypothetical protein